MGGRLPQPNPPRPGLRVSHQGNLLEDDCVVLDTTGLGDRRTRKAAARAEMERRRPPPSRHAFTWTVTLAAPLRGVEVAFTLDE